MNSTQQFLQSISNATGAKALELGGIKVWITLGSEGGLRIPIDNADVHESAREARGKVCFPGGHRTRYTINIQADHKRRLCKVYFQRPSGRVITTIIKRNLMTGIPEYRQRKGSAQYCFDRSNTGSLLLTGKSTQNLSMGVIVVKICEDMNISYSFTFELQHLAKNQDSDDSASEEGDGIIPDILSTGNIPRSKKLSLLTWRNSNMDHHSPRPSCNTAISLKPKIDNIEQSQKKASKKRKRFLQSDELLPTGKFEVESENEVDMRPKKTNDLAKKRLCVLLDKYKEEIVTAFNF